MKKSVFPVIAVLAALFSACATRPPKGAKAAVLIIPAKQVQDAELVEAKAALEKTGVRVTIAAPKLSAVDGMLGGSFKPDATIESIQPGEYDLVACIGGMGVFDIMSEPVLLSKIKAFADSGKYVTAICAASGMLANAGVLKGVKATCYPNEGVIQLLKNGGAIYTDETVVVSGKIVTGNGPDAAVPFGKAIAKLLE